AAPLVGEENLSPVVVEGRGMPVREVGVGDRGNAHRVGGVANVEQESIALTRAAGETDRRIDGDVVALGRARARTISGSGWLADHLGDDAGKCRAQRGA